MCVTNTTGRRPPATIALAPEMVANTPSMLSQRLFGNLFSVETGNSACAAPQQQAEQQVASYPCDMYNQQQLMEDPRQEKLKPKRRRKPQKPGKTAKLNDRHFVVHNYHDHANDPDETDDIEEETHRRRGGVSVAFPLKLHAVLDQVEADGLAHVISWQPHGRSFVVHKPKEFVDHVMPKYFRQTKLTSFQRQLNLYGFSRLTRGADAGGYYHELFLRGKVFLCKRMTRTKVKGTKFKAASSPEQEPDFYKMPPVVVTPHPSSEDEYSYGSDSRTEHYAAAPQPSGFDPLPVTYGNMMQQPADTRVYDPTTSSIPYAAMPEAAVPERSYADQVLDEAVDELFLQEALLENDSTTNGAWDSFNFGDDSSLQDEQLGVLLEQLLEE